VRSGRARARAVVFENKIGCNKRAFRDGGREKSRE